MARRIDAGKMSRIGGMHDFSGKAVDPLPPQPIYAADVFYPNAIRID